MEVVPGLHWVDSIRDVKVYLWLAGDRVVIIDTGMPGRAEAVWRYLERLGYSPEAVDEIWLTHGDFDHAGSAAALKARSGAKIVAHRAEVPLVEGREERRWGSVPLLGSFEGMGGWITRRLGDYRPTTVDRAVEDGDDPSTSGQSESGWQVVHVPGHTPGSICFYHPMTQIAIVGDALRHKRGQVRAPLAAFTPDMDQARVSAQRIADLDFEVCCFGHGPPLTQGARRRVASDLAGWL
jgi:glyoxylase-like metal-dependent hydrolase (beta-lactamase superfamily II)